MPNLGVPIRESLHLLQPPLDSLSGIPKNLISRLDRRPLQSGGRQGVAEGQPRMRLKKGGKNKAVAKADLPSKMCVVCNRPFTWYTLRCRTALLDLTSVGTQLK